MVGFRDDLVVVVDVDGCFTSGGFYSTKEGKFLKKFGPDDWDCIKELQKHMRVQCITADKKGFEIVRKRFEDEMGFNLDIVPHTPRERWDWIKNTYPDKKHVCVMDGCYDYYTLSLCFYAITTIDSLQHVKNEANYVINRVGGHRFVAEACIH